MARFWTFARRMLRHRLLLVTALAMAVVSAGGLGAGLLGMLPILGTIFPTAGDEPKNLPQMVTEWGDKLHKSLGLTIPQVWIDALPTGRFDAVLWIMAALGVLTIVGATANFLHAYLSLTVVTRTIADVRRDVFRRVIHLPLKTVLHAGPTDLISRIVYDTNTLGAGFNALLSRAVAQVTKGLAALGVAFAINWKLTGAAVLVAPVLAIIIRKTGKRIRRASRSALQAQAGLYHAASEALGGLRVVKVHTAERAEAGRFHRINKQVVAQEFRVRTARALSSPLVETITLFVLGTLVLVAAYRVERQRLDPKQLFAVLGFLGVAGAALKPLTGIINDIQQSAAAANRLGDALALETEPGHGHRLPKLPRHEQSIQFDRVSLTYPGAQTPALDDVTLRIEHGRTIAFVGPNGSGKTTLLSLLPRLFDPDPPGRVLIDGRDIREFSVRSLRRQIGVVTQETVLFRGTIRSNIAYAAEGVTQEMIAQAARKARAEEFILDKPHGYDEPIGEGGTGLSGGQRQRLAIARAVLRDPAILILDEATSMIDADSEARIAEALADFSRGRTCLIVAHRLSTVLSADSIVVMDAGRIVDQGTHDQLLVRCDAYRLIAQNQLVRPVPAAST